MRRGQRLAARVPLLLRLELFARLAERNVTMLTDVRYESIDDRGLLITTADGSQQLLEADTLVVAAGSTPSQDLVAALRDQAIPVTVAGDAVEPRGLREAIREGMIAGWSV